MSALPLLLGVQPSVFISHGGGPSFFLAPDEAGPPLSILGKGSPSEASLRNLGVDLSARYGKPSGIVVVSAHWESEGSGVEVIEDGQNLLYDYYGFPKHTYNIKYNAPGLKSDALRKVLSDAGITCKLNTQRGWDHGIFIPLKLMYPSADLPVLQLSLRSGLDAAFHLRLGEALSALTRQNILVLGSGFTTHNMRAFAGRPESWGREFVEWLTETTTSGLLPNDVRARLSLWESSAPGGSARQAHPREEHFIPFLVAAGAGDYRRARKVGQEWVGSNNFSHFIFDPIQEYCEAR